MNVPKLRSQQTALALTMVLCGVPQATWAKDVAFTSGFITYDDALTAAVNVYNYNNPLDKNGNANPPCAVEVDIVDGNNLTIGTGSVSSSPQRDAVVEIALPAPPSPGASFRADVIFTSSKLCSAKKLKPTVSLQEPGFDQANRYEVSVTRGSRTR